MGFNYDKEVMEWTKSKEQEELILRSLCVDENIIKQLRDYDWEVFKSNRRIRRKQDTTADNFFVNIPYYDKKDCNTISDLLNEIENEILFDCLIYIDQTTLLILELKVFGYSIEKISKLLGLSRSSIYKRVQRLKKKLKDSL